MYLLGYLKEGFGNKLFMLMKYINYFRKHEYDMLIVASAKSKHQEDNIFDVFPSLSKIKWLKHVSWKEYDSFKKDGHEIDPSFDFDYNDFMELRPFIRKHFIFHEKYDKLLEKYDTTRGIAVHMRYGDKLDLNIQRFKNHRPASYLVLEKGFYEDMIGKLLEKGAGRIYVFTDSPHIKLNIEAEYVNEDTSETFFLLTKFRRAVLSDSTLSIAAGYMNFYKHTLVIPSYRVRLTGQIVKSPYVNDRYFATVSDRRYILDKKDYSLYVKK